MLSKRGIIVALVGLNLALAAGLILCSYSPPAAYAQGMGRPGDYLMATVQIRSDIDALVVIHAPRAAMHVFRPQEQRGHIALQWVMSRDLNRDFRRRTQ